MPKSDSRMISTSILSAYEPFFQLSQRDFECLGSSVLYIPRFCGEALTHLINESIEILRVEPTLLPLDGSFFVVGDIHGNIRDLCRILAFTKTPLTSRFVFLGDYVDRGEFSVEVLALLLSLKVSRPMDVFLLRGNHEFPELNEVYGFKQQVTQMYNKELFELFNELFSYLPLAAVLNNDTFLVHGGISPLLTLDALREVKRPSISFAGTKYCKLVSDIVWSDPTTEDTMYTQSPRGYGYQFGAKALREFLEKTNLKRVIRAHQCVAHGVEAFDENRLFTVFSSSNYSEENTNKSGMLKIGKSVLNIYLLDPITQYKASDCIFRNIPVGDSLIPVPQRTLRSSMLLSGTTRRRTSSIPRSPSPQIARSGSIQLVNARRKESMTIPVAPRLIPLTNSFEATRNFPNPFEPRSYDSSQSHLLDPF